jgi:RpiB/LacA/LacB family sugar-phosphate isomerase
VKLVVGCDHAGYPLKKWILPYLHRMHHKIIDVGAHNTHPSDYPDYAQAVAQIIQTHRADRGILICGSGVGATVAANKFKGIRAGLCHDTYSAHQGVEHDDANVLCLGSRVIGNELAIEFIRAFLSARFSNEARHRRRLAKIDLFEKRGGLAARRPGRASL